MGKSALGAVAITVAVDGHVFKSYQVLVDLLVVRMRLVEGVGVLTESFNLLLFS